MSWVDCIKGLPISTTIPVVEDHATVRECGGNCMLKAVGSVTPLTQQRRLSA